MIEARTAQLDASRALTDSAMIEYRVPVVSCGTGTGLFDEANSLESYVIASLAKMNTVWEMNLLERIAVVEPGDVNDVLYKTVAAKELLYTCGSREFRRD